MAVTDDRKFTKEFVYNLLEGVKGKTLGEVDTSRQFARTETSPQITGIAGDVIEQSVFGYEWDSDQECDTNKNGALTAFVRTPNSFTTSGNKPTTHPYATNVLRINLGVQPLCTSHSCSNLSSFRKGSSLNRIRANEWCGEYLQDSEYTRVRYQGRSSTLRAFAPS